MNINRIDNANNHRYDAGILNAQHLTGAVALAVDQDGVADACVSVIDGNEISLGFTLLREGLDNQQAAVFISGMADSGDYSAYYFSNDHIFTF